MASSRRVCVSYAEYRVASNSKDATSNDWRLAVSQKQMHILFMDLRAWTHSERKTS